MNPRDYWDGSSIFLIAAVESLLIIKRGIDRRILPCYTSR